MTHNYEIEELINYLQEREANYALLHCNSAYPPPYEDLNLRYLKKRSNAYHLHKLVIQVTKEDIIVYMQQFLLEQE